MAHLVCPAARLRLDVRLARLESRSPLTSFPPAPDAPAWPLEPPAPPAEPCGCSMSPKKSAPTAGGKRGPLMGEIAFPQAKLPLKLFLICA